MYVMMPELKGIGQWIMIGQGVFILYVGHKFGARVTIVNVLLICKHRGIFGVTSLHPSKKYYAPPRL